MLYNTLPAVCIEKVVNMKSGEELYSKMYKSLGLPQRIVLEPNLHFGRQDTTNFEARASVDHLSKEYGEPVTVEYGETRCGNIDSTIQGLPHSTVQLHDDTRKEAVQKLIHQFETHPNREAFKSRLGKGSSVQPIQRKVEGHDPQHGNHGVLRDVRDHIQRTVPQLFNIPDDRHCILYLRNMLATFGQKSQIKQISV